MPTEMSVLQGIVVHLRIDDFHILKDELLMYVKTTPDLPDNFRQAGDLP